MASWITISEKIIYRDRTKNTSVLEF